MCRQMELLCDLLNSSLVPIQDLFPAQVLLNAPYSESIPAQTLRV